MKRLPMRNRLVLLCCLPMALLSCTGETAKVKRKPNFILILADDLGFDDLSIHGNSVLETPNLDSLGKHAVRFNNFHVASVCAPTRASLLTGRNFLRTGVSGVHAGRDYINLDETLISEVFQQNGYQTAMWGKWHSGKANGYFPWDRGFSEAYYSLLYNYYDNTGLLNGEHVQTSGFTTDAITDMALDFLERNKDSTFFAYIPHLAPHAPWRAPDHFIEKYRKKGLSENLSTLYGMIDNLDYNIGRVIDKVSELGIDDNTIVVFLSDNGPNVSSYPVRLTPEEWQGRNVNGFRGNKGQNWQNGIKSPLFISLPQKYKPRLVEEFVKAEDLFPTLLEMAGIEVPGELRMDGQSLVPALEGKEIADEPVFVAHFSPIGDPAFGNELDKWRNNIPFSKEFVETFTTENQRLALLSYPYKYLQNESGQNLLPTF
ncbi:MAG: sulfatase-like hydrolase/transferase, partial [Bacteroidota bacterium]